MAGGDCIVQPMWKVCENFSLNEISSVLSEETMVAYLLAAVFVECFIGESI
jgi:hypothetical protein